MTSATDTFCLVCKAAHPVYRRHMLFTLRRQNTHQLLERCKRFTKLEIKVEVVDPGKICDVS